MPSCTMSDLISQAMTITDTDISNAFTMAAAIMTPYPSAPIKAKITQVKIDPTGKTVKVVWSKASNDVAHSCSDNIAVPVGLMVTSPTGTYLIMSEVSYKFTPVVGHQLGATIPTFTLSDRTFTRPRQSDSVAYPTATACS